MAGIRRDVVLLLLYDREGCVLLQHRGPEAPCNPGRWGFFGGGIESGESPEQALVREAYEELRYTPRDPFLYLQEEFAAENPSRYGTRHYFLEYYPGEPDLELHEGQGMAWYAFPQITELDFSPHHRRNLRRLDMAVQARVQALRHDAHGRDRGNPSPSHS